jgi:predicted permease
MLTVFETVVPVFTVIALGYVLSMRRPLDLRTLADLAILVTSPALMFSVLSHSNLEAGRWGVLAGGTVFVAGGSALIAFFYMRARAPGRIGLLLPAIFWNAGNMLLPCARLAFGDAGLEAAAIVFVTMAILTSTFGIWIAKGENGLGEALRLPLLYGSVGGAALALTGTTLPRIVMEPIEMLADMAIPIMLLNLGIQLHTLRITDVTHSVAVVAIRMGCGIVTALVFVNLFGIEGLDRQVLLLASSMPPAVINVVFAQRYDREPSLVASSIALGTMLSVLVIPTVLFFLT